jgi:hypothetical protein
MIVNSIGLWCKLLRREENNATNTDIGFWVLVPPNCVRTKPVVDRKGDTANT